MKEITMDNFHRGDNNIKKLNEQNIDKNADLKSPENIPHGGIETKKYKDYYDVSHTITTAGASNPNDFDSSVYNRERIYVDKGRTAEKLLVINDGPDTIYLVVSHNGELNQSLEVPIYAGENKKYYNVYELRLRSPTAGTAYRVMEYELSQHYPNAGMPQETIVPSSTPIIQGTTTVSNVAAQIVVASTPIYKVVTVKVRSLGTGTYIAIGSVTAQPFRLTSVGDSLDIDEISNLNKVYSITDAGNTGVLEWFGA